MRSCQLFSLAVVALSFVSMTGCAHVGLVKASGLSGENAPIMKVMRSAAAETAQGFKKVPASPITGAMLKAQGSYAKQTK
jgi:hypothetical protein